MKKNNDKTIETVNETVEMEGVEESRNRPRRKKVYEAVQSSKIPKEVKEAFAKGDWEIRFLRYSIQGNTDLRYLAKCYQEGWEFITANELKELGLENYLAGFQVEDERHFKGLLVSGDLVLAKADKELIESYHNHYTGKARRELDAAEVYSITKRHKFVDTGSKSSVSTSEPRFQD